MSNDISIIAYKIVNKIDRSSFNFSNIPSLESNKYKRYYYKNIIVEAEKNSLGIFLFKNLSTAKDYLKCVICDEGLNDYIILMVETFGKISEPNKISIYSDEKRLDDFYNAVFEKHEWETTNIPPIGTICCPVVGVLD